MSNNVQKNSLCKRRPQVNTFGYLFEKKEKKNKGLFPKINWAYKLMFFYSFYDFRSEVEVVLPSKMKERMNMTSWARQSFDNGTLTRNN